MIRTKNNFSESDIFVNASPSDYTFFTIKKSIIKNNKLSAKAKIVLVILLNNQPGWITYQEKLLEDLKEGMSALRAAIKELEESGYLFRAQLRDKSSREFTKVTFWAYSDIPFNLNIDNRLKELEKQNLELLPNQLRRYNKIHKKSFKVLQRKEIRPDRKTELRKSQANNNINIHINTIKYNKSFLKFWNKYDKKVGHKKKAFLYFSKLSKKEEKELFKRLPMWLKTIGKNKIYRPYPTSFLYQRRWEDDIKKYINGHSHKSVEAKGVQIPPIDIIRKRTGGYYRIVKKTHDQLFDKDSHNFMDKIEFSPSDGAVALCDLEDGIKAIRKDKRKIVQKYNKEIKSPSIIVSDYVWWLKQQDWLDNISVKLFISDHKLFKRFVKKESSTNRRNILTGEYN